jgi:nucleoside-diphosphate-sugar epimerase
MTILITGAAGFIGTNLSKRLLEEGKSVIGVDNFITGSRKNIRYLQTFPEFTFIEKDITDASIIQDLSQFPIEEIYELACPTGVENLKKIPLEMIFTSTLGIKNILELATQKKASFLFSSSSEIYGDPKITPQDESYTGNVDPLSIRACYEEGKRCGESITMAFARQLGINAKVVRIFNTYGPYFSEQDIRAVPQFISQVLQHRDMVIFGNGKKTRSFLYIDDLLDGFFLIMKKGKAQEAYNIGSVEEISIQDVCKTIAKVSKSKEKIIYTEADTLDLKNKRLPCISKIQVLGWNQKIQLEEGLEKTLEIQKMFYNSMP